MSEKIEFTRNYSDNSTDKGFQFEFYCDRCGTGYRTGFQAFAIGNVSGALACAPPAHTATPRWRRTSSSARNAAARSPVKNTAPSAGRSSPRQPNSALSAAPKLPELAGDCLKHSLLFSVSSSNLAGWLLRNKIQLRLRSSFSGAEVVS